MRTRIDIDSALSREILREIGERLQACLGDDELTPTLRLQLDLLRRLDDQPPPCTRGHSPVGYRSATEGVEVPGGANKLKAFSGPLPKAGRSRGK